MILRPLLVLAAGLATVSVAAAQQLRWSQSGTGVNSGYASVVAVAGDVDGDGLDDLIVGDTDASPTAFLDGQVQVLSGADGSVIHDYAGGILDGIGRDVAGVGDVDGDGHAEFAFCAHEVAPVVCSGVDGTPLHVLSSIGTVDVSSLSAAGDVNLDGFPDLIVGSSSAAGFNGRAWVISGAFMANGTPPEILHVFTGAAAGSGSGIAVDGAGDVDGDGHPDLIVGQYAEDGTVGPDAYDGVARVWSGADGSLIRAHYDFGPGGGFGYSVSGAGDLDGDGFAEVVVGAPFDDANGANSGAATVFDGQTGAVVHAWSGNDASDQFGRDVDGVGDVNGDHFPDVMIGAPVDETAGGGGAVWLRSGLNGGLLAVIGQSGGTFGIALAGGADLDGDALADFAVSASSFANGTVYAYGGLCTGANYAYCTAAPNSVSPTGGDITAAGSTSISTEDLTLLARQCPPGQFGVFFYGTQMQQVPYGDGTLCVGGAFHRLLPAVQIDGQGIATLAVDFDAAPLGGGPGQVAAGDTRYFSFWFRDPAGGPVGFNYTNGRVLTFCP